MRATSSFLQAAYMADHDHETAKIDALVLEAAYMAGNDFH